MQLARSATGELACSVSKVRVVVQEVTFQGLRTVRALCEWLAHTQQGMGLVEEGLHTPSAVVTMSWLIFPCLRRNAQPSGSQTPGVGSRPCVRVGM